MKMPLKCVFLYLSEKKILTCHFPGYTQLYSFLYLFL